MTCNADNISKNLLNNLTDGVDFTLPEIDLDSNDWELPDSIIEALKSEAATLDISDLTVKQIDGSGAMDAILKSSSVHLKEEFDKGRITGAEYSKAYSAIVSVGIQTGLQFVLQKDVTKWSAITAQLQAITAKIQLETVKANYIRQKAEALTAKAQYAAATMQLANLDAQYCLLLEQKNQAVAQTALTNQQKTNLAAEALNIPKQGVLLDKQADQVVAQTALTTQQKVNLTAEALNIPKQGALLDSQKTMVDTQVIGQEKANDTATYNLSYILPQQLLLTKEQTEAARAQTLDIRTDGASVVGSIGKQKDLYSQQITSYQRSSEINAAQMFKDAWIAHKSIDEGIDTPASFNATSISEVLSAIKTNNSL